jgi:hypothetical protein
MFVALRSSHTYAYAFHQKQRVAAAGAHDVRARSFNGHRLINGLHTPKIEVAISVKLH